MRFGRLLMAGAMVGFMTTAVQAENVLPEAGSYVAIDGFFNGELSDKWQALEGNEPVQMKMVKRVHPVLIMESNDVTAGKALLVEELSKYYDDAILETLMPLLVKDIESAAAARSHLGMPDSEAVTGAAADAARIRSMNVFFGFEGVAPQPLLREDGTPMSRSEASRAKKVYYTDDPAIDGIHFLGGTIGNTKITAFSVRSILNMVERLQLAAERDMVEIIAPVGKRAIVVYDEVFPFASGAKLELSTNIFSRMNPSEEDLAKRAGLPSTLNVEQQVLEKKIGGFVIYMYDADMNQVGQLMKLFVSSDFMHKRAVWNIDIPRFMSKDVNFIRIGLVVAPTNEEVPMDDPVEFGDVRMRFVKMVRRGEK